jgi:hypothetical protein
MGLESVPRCQHIKTNGTQCGSPALRRRRLCYFHRRVVEQRARITTDPFLNRPLDFPVLEDANSVQMALMQVMQGLVAHTIDHKTAGLLLYGLQSAAVNVRNTKFEAYKATDVVIDRDTVHLTAMNGPQWFEEDFDEEESEEEDGEEVGEVEDEGDSEEEDGSGVEDEKVEARTEEVDAKAAAEAPAAARKPVQGTGEDLCKRLAMRVGENPVDAMKRLMGTVQEIEQSG